MQIYKMTLLDLPQLLAKLEEGYDLVSGWRKDRQDAALTNGRSRLRRFTVE